MLCVLLLLLSPACARDEPPLREQIDLIAAFRATDAGCARERVDFGTPDGDAARADGWLAASGNDAFAWTTDRRAAVRLCLGDPAERRIRLRARALGDTRSGRPRLAPVFLRLNGQRVGTIRVAEEPATFDLALPARLQRPGDNLLELEQPMVQARGRVAASGPPAGSVGYDWLEVVEAGDGERPAQARPQLDGDALVLPPGAAVDYFVRAPAHARLRAMVGAAPGAGAGRLRVTARRDGGERPVLDESEVGAGEERALDVALGTAPGEVVALSLAAGVGAALRVRAPSLAGAPADDAPALVSSGGATHAATAARPSNVLLYVVDTLRADHLGCYGYDLPTSPRIDALAREGVLFERVVAQSSWTRPAMASLLTGLDPWAHGTMGLRQALPATLPTLPEMLAAQGYATAAFVTNVNVSAPFGFGRGFATFRYLQEDPARASTHVLSDELGREAAAWLVARDPDEPFFLWVHASDPHAPYTAAKELRPRFRRPGGGAPSVDAAELQRRIDSDPSSLGAAEVRELVAAYDAEVAFNDANLGSLLDQLDRLGLRDSTLVVVTADHGEEFAEHGGFSHGHTLYDELLRVPLIVRLPGGARAGERRRALARQIDLVPTVLTQLGLPAPALPGRALLAAADDEGAPREARSHTKLARRDLAAVVTPSWKAVRRLGGAVVASEVYDLATDPAEKEDVAAERPVLAGYATQAIRRAAAAAPAPAATPLPVDADTERRLRALGYVD